MASSKNTQQVTESDEWWLEAEPEEEQSGIISRSRMAVRLSQYDEERLNHEEKSELIELLSDSAWSKDLSEFAATCLVPGQIYGVVLEELRKKLKFIKKHVPQDLLNNYRKPEFAFLMSDLFRKRLSFLEAINDLMGQEGWNQILSDPEKLQAFSRAAFTGDLAHHYAENSFAGFSQRFAVPITATEGAEDRLAELNEVVRQTGLEELALPLVRNIRVIKHRSPQRMAGDFNRKTGDLEVSTTADKRALLIPALLHELGHAFQQQLARDDEARAIYDRYLVSTQMEPGTSSVTESFAEDFRLFWLKPQALSEAKLTVINELFDRLLLAVNKDEIRGRIENVLKDYYGIGSDELLGDVDCY